MTSSSDRQRRLPWWLEHAPQRLSEMALAPAVRTAVEDSIDRSQTNNLCLAGPAGIGKTSIARILASSLPCQSKLFQCSLDRGIDLIRGDVTRFLGGRPWPSCEFRLAILEEADGLTGDAGRGLRNALDAAPPRARVILTTNSERRVHAALLSRCLRLDLSNPPVAERLRVVRRILKLEGASEPPGLEAAATTFTDMRQLVIELERAVRTGVAMRGASRGALSTESISTAPPVEVTSQSPGTLRRARRPEREGLIIAELAQGSATEADLRERLTAGGWQVPQPTLYDDLSRLCERGQVESEGYPKRWFLLERGNGAAGEATG